MDRYESTILLFHNEELVSKKPKSRLTKTEIGFLTCIVILLSALFGSIIFLIISGKNTNLPIAFVLGQVGLLTYSKIRGLRSHLK